jgi:hypothetical protein
VVLEFQHEADSFREEGGLNYDCAKKEAIRSRFVNILASHPEEESAPSSIAQRLLDAFMGRQRKQIKYETDNLFVVFSAFAPLACEEADSRLTDKQIEKLKVGLNNPDLWLISRCFGKVTVMFYTEQQLSKYDTAEVKEEYASKYFELVKANDEFGYLSSSDFSVSFDSKQNIDEKFESNWYYYYK